MAPIHDLTMLDLLIYRAYYQLVFVLHKNFYCVYTGTDWRVMCYTIVISSSSSSSSSLPASPPPNTLTAAPDEVTVVSA